jgi:hypothetical protein
VKSSSRAGSRFTLRTLAGAAWAAALAAAFGAPAVAQSLLVIENPAERLRYGKTYTQIDGFGASDAIAPIHLTEDPWSVPPTPRAGRNLTMANARSSIGAFVGPLNVDYFYRREWWLEGTADSLRFYQLARANGLVANSGQLDIDYHWEGFDADGLRFALADKVELFNGHDAVLGISIAALRVQQARIESGSGRFSSDGSSASLNSRRDIWYSGFRPSSGNDSLTAFTPAQSREVSEHGYGYSVDLGLRYDFGHGGALRLAVSDALARFKWNGTPHIVQMADIGLGVPAATSDSQISIGQPGIVQSSEYQTLRAELPSKRSIGIDYPIGHKWRLHGEHVKYRGETFSLLGTSKRITDSLRLRTDYDLRWKTVGATMTYRKLVLGLRADSLALSHMHAVGMTMHLEVDF